MMVVLCWPGGYGRTGGGGGVVCLCGGGETDDLK
jgi:hypothetical protein